MEEERMEARNQLKEIRKEQGRKYRKKGFQVNKQEGRKHGNKQRKGESIARK